MQGYGAAPPDAQWPGGARIAVQFVINYEEGGENCILHGDPASEAFLSEIVGAAPWPGMRHWNMESIYEYGARAGFWRLHRLFTGLDVPVTVYGVATALARSPAQVAAMQAAGWEIASHGLKWIEYRDMAPEEERSHMEQAVRLHTEVTGERPLGWYTGRCSANTVRLAAEEGGFDYVSDAYADDLPYWIRAGGRDQLIVPYTLDANDMRFAVAQGFNSGDQFFAYLRDSFDALYAEGAAGSAKMLSVGLHCRLVGRPGRVMALKRFIEYAAGHDRVWFARRIDIARHWRASHPPAPSGDRPSTMDREVFVSRFGGVFGQAPWIAERAWEDELGPAHDTAAGLHNALARKFRAASEVERLGVLKDHTDRAATQTEPRQLTDAERLRLTDLERAYMARHGFPFIAAATGLDGAGILQALERRLANDTGAEFAEACRQVEHIAGQRLSALLE